MNTIAIILMIAAIAGAVVFVLWKRRKKPVTDGITFPNGIHLPGTPGYAYATPGGAQVVSVVPVPDDVLPLIDEGITNQLTRINAAKPDWANKRNISDYHIFFIDPMAVNQVNDPGSPALIVSGVQTAGTCVGVAGDGFSGDFIVAPHQQDTQWRYRSYLVNTTWHESEHQREWANDRGVFYYFVQPGMDNHPHFP